MLLKMCARCKTPVVYPATYCERCKEIVDKEKEERLETAKKQYNKRYNKTRDPKLIQFYNSPAWRSLSAKVMQDNAYRCKDCGAIATQVHHEIEVNTPEGWDLRFEYSNLVPLCDRCHNRRHKRFSKRR